MFAEVGRTSWSAAGFRAGLLKPINSAPDKRDGSLIGLSGAPRSVPDRVCFRDAPRSLVTVAKRSQECEPCTQKVRAPQSPNDSVGNSKEHVLFVNVGRAHLQGSGLDSEGLESEGAVKLASGGLGGRYGEQNMLERWIPAR